MSSTPIAEYALLSDRHSAALISSSGSGVAELSAVRQPVGLRAVARS